MVDIRCECGKILCQHEAYVVVIRCRHCKRTLHIGIKDQPQREMQASIGKYHMVKPSVVNI